MDTADETRTRPVRLLLTPNEHAAFRVAAAQRGLSMSAYALSLVIRALDPDYAYERDNAIQSAQPTKPRTRNSHL